MRYATVFATLLLTCVAASAASFDAPKRKSGLWEIKVENAAGMGGQTMQQCIDEKTDDLTKNNMAGKDQSCSKTDTRKEGDKIVSESVCKIMNSTAKSRAVFTGRFDSAYKVDIKSTYEPPLNGMKESTTAMDAKWIGACKPGQKAGDISMPGMPNINMQDMMKNLPKRP
ncbi:MAG: hypothetical protein HW419_3013 [Deltaproteobacteria bacterium]|nr:hypothetical protein [Deltaproteobacteria bacterium]MBM2805120.1 hypothetical protein [Deltaproteobacteria bacterium]